MNKTKIGFSLLGITLIGGGIALSTSLSSCGKANTRSDINLVITKPHLSYIQDNDGVTILARINAMNNTNLTLNVDVTITNITTNTATIDGHGSFKNSIEVYFAVSKNISNLINITDLGYISNSTNYDIVKRVNELNGTRFVLDINVTITASASDSATINGTSDFTGSIGLTWTMKINISGNISITNLGLLPDDSDSAIIACVNSLNSTTYILGIDVTITNKNNTSATINGINAYMGSVDLTFVIPTDIGTMIKTRDLSMISNTDDSTIVDAINKVNETNFILGTDVTVTNKSDSKATINGINAYTGSVDVTYYIFH